MKEIYFIAFYAGLLLITTTSIPSIIITENGLLFYVIGLVLMVYSHVLGFGKFK